MTSLTQRDSKVCVFRKQVNLMPNEFSDENYNREYVWVAIIQVAAAACVPKHSQRISKGRVSFADVI